MPSTVAAKSWHTVGAMVGAETRKLINNPTPCNSWGRLVKLRLPQIGFSQIRSGNHTTAKIGTKQLQTGEIHLRGRPANGHS